MKKTIATLAPIGPLNDCNVGDFVDGLRRMREIHHKDFSGLNAEMVKGMRSALVASIQHGVGVELVADYANPGKGWPASLTWVVPGAPGGEVFVSNTLNRDIDEAKSVLDIEALEAYRRRKNAK